MAEVIEVIEVRNAVVRIGKAGGLVVSGTPVSGEEVDQYCLLGEALAREFESRYGFRVECRNVETVKQAILEGDGVVDIVRLRIPDTQISWFDVLPHQQQGDQPAVLPVVQVVESDDAKWAKERDQSCLETGKAKMVIGIRSKIFDSWESVRWYVEVLETFWLTKWAVEWFYTYVLGHPGPRHLEYFHVRRFMDPTSEQGLEGGNISSFEASDPNSGTLTKFLGCPSKVVVSRFDFRNGNEFWVKRNVDSDDLVIGTSQSDVGAELSRNCRYDYCYVPIVDTNDDAYKCIARSYRPNGGNEAVVPRVFPYFNQYFLSRSNCGHYAMDLVHNCFGSSVAIPSIYLNYGTFRYKLQQYFDGA